MTDKERLERVVREHEIDTIFPLAAILSATGMMKPPLTWHVNIPVLRNVLEVAREQGLARVFHPSSIAVFGPETLKDLTPQEIILHPKTVYVITKLTGELLRD